MPPKALAVIPARYASTRFPGKPLADIAGKPMIQWVVERARQAKRVSAVVVATDDERIFQAVKKFGGDVQMTDPSLPSGTDRVAEIAKRIAAEVYVNVQGDEPLIDPDGIDRAIALLDRFEIGTLRTPFKNPKDLEQPSQVKVITDKTGRAIYFSRFPIPYSRGLPSGDFACWRHVGLYAFRRDALFRFHSLGPSPLELAESLEQLRALENGMTLGVADLAVAPIGIDTPEDLETLRLTLNRRSS